MSTKRSIDYGRIAFVLAGVGVMAAVMHFGGEAAEDNLPVMLAMVIAFSSLSAAVAIAMLASGDPGGLYAGGWRLASIHRRQKMRATNRCCMLMWACILAAGLSLAVLLLGNDPALDGMVSAMERAAAGFGAGVLFWMLSLPAMLRRMQKDRLDIEVDSRRESPVEKENSE